MFEPESQLSSKSQCYLILWLAKTNLLLEWCKSLYMSKYWKITFPDHNFAIMPSTVFPFLIFCYMEYSSSWWGSTYKLYSQLNITRNGIGSDLCVILRAPTPPKKKKQGKKNNRCKCSILCVYLSSTYNIWLLMFL